MPESEKEHDEHQKTYEFSVDGRDFVSEVPVLTGAQIKARASVDPTFGLFREGRHGQSDTPIRDEDEVSLRNKHENEFHTMPPATFGGGQ